MLVDNSPFFSCRNLKRLAQPRQGKIRALQLFAWLCSVLCLPSITIGLPGPVFGKSDQLEQTLHHRSAEIRAEFNRIFQTEFAGDVPLRLLEEEQFFKEMTLPEHSVAVYADGEIVIGIPAGRRLNPQALERTLRHEFVHAYVDRLSGGQCPAWFDEGLAQFLEGRIDDSRELRLRMWLASGQQPIQLGALVDNLHLLDPELVPVAYGEALVAVRSLINRKGFSAIRAYLLSLGAGKVPEEAFVSAFNEGLPQFEQRLDEQLIRLTIRHDGNDE